MLLDFFLLLTTLLTVAQALIAVGREQTKNVALLPDNKPKNRFVNIHPCKSEF